MQQQQSQQQQQQQQQASVVSNTTPKTAAPPAVTTPIPSKPTSQPVASEARLSNAPRATPSSTASSSVSPGVGGPHLAPLIGQRLQDLVKSIDPNYVIEPEAEEQVLQLADDFLEKVTRQSIRLAHHRGSKTLDVQDVQMVLSKQWGIVIPGLGPPSFKPTKTPGSGNKAGVPQSGGSAGGSAGSLKRKTMDGNAAAENRNKRANLGGLPPPPLTSTSTAGNSGFI
jgi:transcription initiation factor TFIID subunit 12